LIRRAALLAGVALLAVAGCGGGGPNAQDVLKQTASNLGKIRAGTLGVKLLVTPSGGGEPFGFELHGPFRLAGGANALPVTRLMYTQIANGKRATATLVSNGTDAYVESNGQKLPLSPAQADTLQRAGAQLRGASGGARLVVGAWVKDPKASDGGEVGGAETDKVTAKLDVVAAVDGLLSVARATGQAVPSLSAADETRLRDAVRSTSFVLYSGKRDRLLRKLDLSVDFGFDVPSDLKAALGDLVGAKVDFELAVSNPRTT
jgi:hypothetical protein